MTITAEQAKAQLFDLLTGGGDLAALCNCVAEFVGNPVALTLPTRTIVAHSQGYASRELMDEYISAGKLMSKEEYFTQEDEFSKQFRTGRAGVFLWPYTRYKHLNCGCLYKNRYVAVLDCPLVNEVPSEAQITLFEIAAPVFVVALKAMGMLRGAGLEPINLFLSALLSGNIDLDYQRLYMRNTIFDMVDSFQLVWLLPHDREPATDLEQRLNDFCTARKVWWCVPYENGFVILLDAQSNRFLSVLADTFGDRLRMSVSDAFQSLRDTLSQLELARMALQYSTTDAVRSNLIAVDDYKTLIAYFYAHANSDLDIFSSNLLDHIREYDAQYNTDYMETLRVCVHYNQDVAVVAERLRVHKNTVFYRLRQLRELFGVDLKNIRQIANLYLTLCMEFHK